MSHCDLSVSSQMHSSKWNLNLTITTQKVIQVNSRLILNSYRPPLIKTVKAVSLLDIGTVPEVSQSSDNHLWSLTWFVFIRPRQHQGSVPLLWGFLWRCVESDSCLKCWKGQLLPWRFTCDLTYLSQTVTSSGDSWYITPEAWQHWWQTQLSANTKLSAPVTYFNLLDRSSLTGRFNYAAAVEAHTCSSAWRLGHLGVVTACTAPFKGDAQVIDTRMLDTMAT